MALHDNNASVANLEYRWVAFVMLDMALFADAGNVRAARLIGFRNIKTDAGLAPLKNRDAYSCGSMPDEQGRSSGMVRLLHDILIFSGVILATEPAAPKPISTIRSRPRRSRLARSPPESHTLRLPIPTLRARRPDILPSGQYLGEVPNSSWYTNRHATRRMTTEELAGTHDANRPVPPYEVIGGKTEGITPDSRWRPAARYTVKPTRSQSGTGHRGRCHRLQVLYALAITLLRTTFSIRLPLENRREGYCCGVITGSGG